MDMKFLRSTEGEKERNRIRNNICREVGIQNLVTELEECRKLEPLNGR
jgi:hypothetical protein